MTLAVVVVMHSAVSFLIYGNRSLSFIRHLREERTFDPPAADICWFGVARTGPMSKTAVLRKSRMRLSRNLYRTL